jgi:ABC-type multidrug transport system ATPase subunit
MCLGSLCPRPAIPAGKTTLLDVLAARKTAGLLSPGSEIMYNGRAATPAFLRRRVGYVEQHDTLLSMLTPFEMLLYTAELKHPLSQPHAEKKAQVAELIARWAGTTHQCEVHCLQQRAQPVVAD